jgi:hypothetical protein
VTPVERSAVAQARAVAAAEAPMSAREQAAYRRSFDAELARLRAGEAVQQVNAFEGEK